jgi:ATP-dependent DNA helicase RecG
VEIAEFDYDGKRVLVLTVPPRPIGTALHYKGRYLMRSGGSLVPMTAERLQVIFAEAQPDFSGIARPDATLADLDPAAIERFRTLWHQESGNGQLLSLPPARLLADAELITCDGGVTIAALVLLGTYSALGRHLRLAEVIFEYRNSEASIAYQQRKEYRQGYLLYDNELWNQINLRNEVQPVREGMVIRQVPVFNEEVVREALLNAVCHRDYRNGESIFVRQYPRRLEVESPGGFPDNITPATILERQFRRNRLIADALEKAGLIERSSQGVDKMFRLMILESKPRPDYTGSDENRVLLRLSGEVQNPNFVNYLAKIEDQQGAPLDLYDLLLLDDIRQGKVHRADDRLRDLLRRGLVEKVGRARATRYVLPKETGGVSVQPPNREEMKSLLLRYLEQNERRGKLPEFQELLPGLSRKQVHTLLKQLREEGKVRFIGPHRTGHWEMI